MSILTTARFADTVAKLPQLDRANPHGLPEVAFVGRSNAGKSSCINTLCNQKRLAFSSRTPGRTQALNLFAVGPSPWASWWTRRAMALRRPAPKPSDPGRPWPATT